MSTSTTIDDPMACRVINKIGARGLVSIGDLLQAWENNKADEKIVTSGPKYVLNNEFVDSTRLELALAGDEIKAMGEEIKALRNDVGDLTGKTEMDAMREEMRLSRENTRLSRENTKRLEEEVNETREDLASLIKVNKDIYERLMDLEGRQAPPPLRDILGKRSCGSEPDWFSKKHRVVAENEDGSI